MKRHVARCNGPGSITGPGSRIKGTWPCEVCGKVFNKSYNLKVHLTSHTGKKDFACTQCGKCFIAKRTLIQHTEKNHPESLAQFEVEKTKPCKECDESFSSRTDLWEHLIMKHGRPYPVRCVDCKQGFWGWDQKQKKSHIENCGGKLEKLLEYDWRKDY